jgi:hypothetical protein
MVKSRRGESATRSLTHFKAMGANEVKRMGITLCPRHGRRGIAFVCPHVNEALLKSEPLPKTKRVSADLDSHDHRMEASLCQECAALATTDSGGFERFGEQGLDWFFQLKTEPVCSGCLADAERML